MLQIVAAAMTSTQPMVPGGAALVDRRTKKSGDWTNP